MVRPLSKKTRSVFTRNFIFGVEDSLVSTVGLLAGVAVADVERHTLILTGGVLIAVEALSMGVGSLLSEDFTERYVEQKNAEDMPSGGGALIMFASYIVAGFIPLSPYLLLPRASAMPASIAASCGALFLLGFLGARKFGARGYRSGLKMLLLGGGAILVGVLVGQFLHLSI